MQEEERINLGLIIRGDTKPIQKLKQQIENLVAGEGCHLVYARSTVKRLLLFPDPVKNRGGEVEK